MAGTGIYTPTYMLGSGTASSSTVLLGDSTWSASLPGGPYLPLAGGTMTGALNMGGQTIYGNTTSSGNLALSSTSHATKGKVVVGSTFAIDETTGNTAFGHTSPGADYAVDIHDGSFLVQAATEEGLYFRRTGVLSAATTNPLFMLGRIIGNAYGAEFRFIYFGDEAGGSPERTIMTLESTGTLATVKKSGIYGSYYEGFTAGDTKPYFRINTYQPGFASPSIGYEFGPGGSTETDAALVRYGPGIISLTKGQAASKQGGAFEFTLWDTSTVTNEPGTPTGSQAYLFLREDGSGNGQLRAQFPSGTSQIIAQEGGGAVAAHATQHKSGGSDEIKLHELGAPTSSVDFNQQQVVELRLENRTSDPGSPAVGEIWLRTDL